MGKYESLRQFISSFIKGPNQEAILQSLADQLQKNEDLSIAVTDQLTISTASGVYLDKRLAEKNITRPAELGMEDLAFRQMGIQINQAKQIIDAIHTVLTTFYGDETVRAFTTSGQPAPYNLAAGDDLSFIMETGEERTLTLIGDEFENIQNATAEELADVLTRFIRSDGSQGYAQVYLDVDTGLKYVRVFGSALGPYGMVQITGGRLQNKLEFPELRPTELSVNTTVWEITRNLGSTHRFRWVSGPQPLLSEILVGDLVMIYGQQFESSGFVGTLSVTNVRPPKAAPAADAGFFEVTINGTTPLSSSVPDQLPPPNTSNNTYSITLTQSSYDDLKFFLAKKSTPYGRSRYSLAWEPNDSLLRIYMPATTKVVKRDLIGSGHLHLLYGSGEFNGARGHATDPTQQIIVTSDYGFVFPQDGLDDLGTGGTISYGVGPTVIDIDYVVRESGYTRVFTKTPHGITGVVQPDGRILSSTVVNIQVDNVLQDDQANTFLGPYVVDPTSKYTITNQFVTLREKIVAGEKKSTLLVDGMLPNELGELIFSLNQDTEESPVKYLAAQSASSATPVNISTISQNGNTVTVVTQQPHGVIVGQNTLISGTINFNGVHAITGAPSATVFTFNRTSPGVIFEATGTETPQINGAVSTLIMDSSYTFKSTHEVGSDITLLSDVKAYEPSPDGSDYGFYITGTAAGRVFAAELMDQITALGINLEIIIIYPSDVGLGNEGGSADETDPPTSDKVWVWGGD
jgi:hypothetical protein